MLKIIHSGKDLLEKEKIMELMRVGEVKILCPLVSPFFLCLTPNGSGIFNLYGSGKIN